MLNRNEIQIRDPFVFSAESEGLYYLFGTTDKNPWNSKGTGFDAYTSRDLENFEGPYTVFTPPDGFWGTHDFWAPEVHRFKDRYYLLASFTSENHRRATQILVSDSILGPYLPLSDTPVTPSVWECLDGTLFIDQQDKPWIVFCHEWVQANDGAIYGMPLSDDLETSAGEVQLLFKASEAQWSRPLERRDGSGLKDARVTDGPYLHRQADGRLIMLWSSLGEKGYAMGCAVSENGLLAGPWLQREAPLVSMDGGHGMVFTDFSGKQFITYHSPNKTPYERFVFHEVEESVKGLILLDATENE